MTAEKVKFGMVALCDNVYRDQLSSKPILAGMYSGDLLLDTVPGQLRLALYAELYVPSADPHSVDLTFFLGKKKFGEASVTVEQANLTDPVVMILPAITFNVDAPATLEIRAGIDGGRTAAILKKGIRLQAASV
jgi:hypothetical protein